MGILDLTDLRMFFRKDTFDTFVLIGLMRVELQKFFHFVEARRLEDYKMVIL